MLAADGWSAPVRLPDVVNADPSTFAPSVAADGSLWFMHPVDGGRRFRLYRASWHDGRFEPPQALPFSGGTTNDVDPAVAPDESFVVFGSSRAPAHDMDLFIAFREGATWGEPRPLGDAVNSAGSDAEARLSPDARTLYFSSERRSTAASDRDAAWNNGKYNVWRVSLAACPAARRDGGWPRAAFSSSRRGRCAPSGTRRAARWRRSSSAQGRRAAARTRSRTRAGPSSTRSP